MMGCGPLRMTADCMDVFSWFGGTSKVPARSPCGHAAYRRAQVREAEPAQCGSARPQVGEHRQDAAVVVLVGREAELAEDRRHVLLHRPVRDLQSLADALVRASFGHELEHLALAVADRAQRPLLPA